jgi:hypothetical protein
MTEGNDREAFLSRWSRRKRQAAEPVVPPPRAEDTDTATSSRPAHEPARTSPAPPSAPTKIAAEPIVDLSKLPSLDSIGPATDIRPFLQPGIPPSLARAALRRLWSADPMIRDYIGPSENAWDFTAPDGMHGFGPLLPTDDVKRLLAQVFREDGRNPGIAETDGRPEDRPRGDETAAIQDGPEQDSPEAEARATEEQKMHLKDSLVSNEPDSSFQNVTHESLMVQRSEGGVAAQHIDSDPPQAAAILRRRHGKALPI